MASHRLPNARRRTCGFVATLILVSGCDGATDPRETSHALPEMRGTEISDVAFDVSLLWTSNSEELLFVPHSGDKALAYRPATGTVENLAISSDGWVSEVAHSADRLETFTLARFPGVVGSTLRRHTATETTTIATNAPFGFVSIPIEGFAVLAAPTQPVIAYVTIPNTLNVLRRGGAPAAIGDGCSGLLAFSPDESHVLCRSFSGTGFTTHRLDGGDKAAVVLPPEVEVFPEQALWTADGIRVLYRKGTDIRKGSEFNLYDVANQTSRPVIPGSPDFLFHVFRVDIAVRANRLAFAIANCGKGDPLQCDLPQLTIYTVDMTTNKMTLQVVHSLPKDDSFLPKIALSPDGSHLVYVIHNQLYNVDLK